MQNDFPRNNQAQQSNWPFLVIAVLMAVVLWLFVRTGGQPLGQRSVVLPVTVTNGGPRLAVTPRQVEIRLEGAGVGLAIIKRLVERRGGTVSLDRAAAGGAAFRFTWLGLPHPAP